MYKTPIVFLTYKRPEETKKILEIFLKVKPKKLYIFQDGKKLDFNETDINNHKQTSEIIKNFSQIKSKKFFFSKNIGQKYIGFKILNKVFRNEEKAIILEDDCIPEFGFFRFCDLMLKKYHSRKNIAHISGCNLYYGTSKKRIIKEDYLFSKYPHFMGWATWKDRWKKYYDPNIEDWPSKKEYFLNDCKLKEGEKRYFSYYLDKIYYGKQIAWDTQWLYYNILNNLKTIVPTVNLIKNIGFYNSPTGKSAKKFRNLLTKNIIFPIKENNSKKLCSKYDEYLYRSFYNRPNLIIRIIKKIKIILKTLIFFRRT